MGRKHVQMDQIYQSHQLPSHLDTYMWRYGHIQKSNPNPLLKKFLYEEEMFMEVEKQNFGLKETRREILQKLIIFKVVTFSQISIFWIISECRHGERCKYRRVRPSNLPQKVCIKIHKDVSEPKRRSKIPIQKDVKSHRLGIHNSTLNLAWQLTDEFRWQNSRELYNAPPSSRNQRGAESSRKSTFYMRSHTLW